MSVEYCPLLASHRERLRKVSQPLSEPTRAARPAARRVPEEKGERDRERKRGRERVACSAQLPAPCRGPSPIFNRPIALQTDRRSWCCSSMSTPYSFSAFPREPPKYPVINAAPSTGAVIANFGAEDVGRIFGTAAIGAVWGFVWGAPEPRLLVLFRVGGSEGEEPVAMRCRTRAHNAHRHSMC